MLINANLRPYPDTAAADPPARRPTTRPAIPQAVPARRHGVAAARSSTARGAEIVRWTLDVNNDGAVDASDLADANGVDAQRTRNPDDYVLVRQVYGDSTGNVAGNNGGITERVALVRAPGGGVPPMFTVYLRGQRARRGTGRSGPGARRRSSATSSASRCSVRRARAASRTGKRQLRRDRASHRGQLDAQRAQLRRSTSTRVDGYVFDDANGDQTQGRRRARRCRARSVRLGKLQSTVTDATGYYLLPRPGRHLHAAAHAAARATASPAVPDSFVVTVPPGARDRSPTRSIPGGCVNVFVYDDLDGNGTYDTGERRLPSVQGDAVPRRRAGVHGRSAATRRCSRRRARYTVARDAARLVRGSTTPIPLTRNHGERRRP